MVVSVIIPTLNSSAYLKRAIESVLIQDCGDMEIIVVDGGSEDETHDIAISYGEKIRWIHEPTQAVPAAKNRGVAAAKNTGISNATGTYVAFLDSDDEWLPDKVSYQLSLFEKHPDVAMVSGAINNVYQDGSSSKVGSREKHGKLLPTLIQDNPVSNSTVMIRREALVNIKPWFNRDLSVAEDWQFWIRLSARWPLYISPQVMVNRYIRDGSLAHCYSDAFKHVDYYKEVYGSLWSDPLLSNYRDSNRNKVAASQMIVYANVMHRHNKFGEAIRYLFKASLLAPFNWSLYKGWVRVLLPKSFHNKIRAFYNSWKLVRV